MTSATIPASNDASTAPEAAPAIEPIMRLVNVHRGFGRLSVLRGLNVDLNQGETTVIMGPSGCGKSVMLKHLIGLLRPDAGEVWFDRTRIDQLSESKLGEIRRRIGFLFQHGALFDSMTVGDNVGFPLRELTTLNAVERQRRINRMLHMVGVPDSQHLDPATLSGGQRKRIALARAVVLEPSIVMYDEPTSGLDPIRSDIIGELIMRLQRALQLTSIVVTHDIQLSFRIADRMILLHEGRVHLDGPPDVFRQTTDPEVRRFLEGRATRDELAGLEHDFHGEVGAPS